MSIQKSAVYGGLLYHIATPKGFSHRMHFGIEKTQDVKVFDKLNGSFLESYFRNKTQDTLH